MRLEEQIQRLASVGIPLNDRIKLEDLLISFDRERYEATPFKLLLFRMGGEIEEAPWGRLISDRVWHFDTECIDGDGSYVSIVERLAMMALADERFDDIRDKVDRDDEEAWVRYLFDGEPRHLDAELEDDWADLGVLREVAGDLEEGKRSEAERAASGGKERSDAASGEGSHRFAYAEDGQALLIIYLDQKNLRALGELTGLRFSWLSDS